MMARGLMQSTPLLLLELRGRQRAVLVKAMVGLVLCVLLYFFCLHWRERRELHLAAQTQKAAQGLNSA